MLRKTAKENGWTKQIIVLSLMCLIFSFAVNARNNSDKLLNPQQLANLKTGLKQALQENLAVSETDGEMYAAITQKWDARNDLAGKSKRKVIDLMYEDVKSVIADTGIQYQVSEVFSLYKIMPDEQFSGQTTSPPVSNSKPEAVEHLTKLTYLFHPYVGIEEQLENLPETKDVEAGKAEDRKNRIEGLDAALKVNNKLTADQKAFVRANYDKLIKITDTITKNAINKNFPTEQWIMEGLNKTYSARFTLKEINDLLRLFSSVKGVRILLSIRQTEMSELITGNGGKLDFTAADKAEYDKFTVAALGKKFIAAYIIETEAYEKSKDAAAQSIPNGDGFAIYEPANLNKPFNKFVADNYKK